MKRYGQRHGADDTYCDLNHTWPCKRCRQDHKKQWRKRARNEKKKQIKTEFNECIKDKLKYVSL